MRADCRPSLFWPWICGRKAAASVGPLPGAPFDYAWSRGRAECSPGVLRKAHGSLPRWAPKKWGRVYALAHRGPFWACPSLGLQSPAGAAAWCPSALSPCQWCPGSSSVACSSLVTGVRSSPFSSLRGGEPAAVGLPRHYSICRKHVRYARRLLCIRTAVCGPLRRCRKRRLLWPGQQVAACPRDGVPGDAQSRVCAVRLRALTCQVTHSGRLAPCFLGLRRSGACVPV